MTEEQKKQLESLLWAIADDLRGSMDADEFKDYILGFIFYKYLSEKLILKAKNDYGVDYANLDDSKSDIIAAVKENALDDLGYFLKPSELFHKIASKGAGLIKEADEADHRDDEALSQDNFILEDLTRVLNSIEQSTMGTESEDDFDKLFQSLDLTSNKLGKTVGAKNKMIAKVLGHLDAIDFELENTEADVLGDAYEYLIGKFASGAGKKAGEFYTPQQVSKILAQIVTTGKTRLKSVYDPTCGSGSLLLRVARELGHKHGETEKVGMFYGQELNTTTYNLARMNMILHDVHFSKFDIKQDNTLTHPMHTDQKMEAIVANPPFSAKWSAHTTFNSDDRFAQYGRLAPASKADFAFIQHMVYHLDDHGQMAVVMPHGVLFRGAAEGEIRKHLIEELNVLDAVIGLPANIFYGTSIPTCILVFKSCREKDQDVLFIDASNDFEKAKNQNNLRESDIEKIVSTYRDRTEKEKYSHIAPLAEIRENDYNLNIPRYVDTFEEEEPIDLKAVTADLKAIDTKMVDIDTKIADFCKELGIEMPF